MHFIERDFVCSNGTLLILIFKSTLLTQKKEKKKKEKKRKEKDKKEEAMQCGLSSLAVLSGRRNFTSR